MVKSGRKVALAFLGSYALAQLLRERGIIEDDPLVVYTYSAMIRDLLAILPETWEVALEDLMGRLLDKILGGCGRRGNPPQDNP